MTLNLMSVNASEHRTGKQDTHQAPALSGKSWPSPYSSATFSVAHFFYTENKD